jgi:hypothetical protein
MQELNELVLKSIFKKLKIDLLVLVSEMYCWADQDPDGKSGGIDFHLQPEYKCFGINIENKTVKPLYKILDQHIKEILPEKIYNFLLAQCLVNSDCEPLLKQKSINFIEKYWESLAGKPGMDCWAGHGTSTYSWEIFLLEKDDKIKLHCVPADDSWIEGLPTKEYRKNSNSEFSEKEHIWNIFEELSAPIEELL